MWLRNCWYVIAYEHELQSGAMLSRLVLNEPIVVYKNDSGDLVALEDRCPHRHAPLSAGKRESDGIRCAYHGLKFAEDGRCLHVPGMDSPPSHISIKAYPVEVKNTWVFVWMGDPAKADITMLPDNWSCAHPEWKNKPGYLHYDTPYLLICDNLLDFSHLSYVHEKTLGGSTEIALARPTVEKIDADGQRGIRVSRFIPNVPAPPFYQRFRQFETNLDRWFVYDFLFPGTLLMSSGGRPTGDAPDDNSRAVTLHSCQTLTPETDTSTHYFWSQSHPSMSGDDGIAESIHNSIVTAFNEDRDIITAQFQNMMRSPGPEMVPLHMDSALIQFRNYLQEEVDREAG